MYSWSLVSLAVVVVVVSAGLIFASLPPRGLARPITAPDVVFIGGGLAGLAFHCGAMFFRQLVESVPGTETAIADIRALGTASVIWYLVPVAFVLVGLRRQHPGALATAVLAFAAVGITMYNGGSVQAHLAAIYASVALLVVVAATAVIPSWRHRPVSA